MQISKTVSKIHLPRFVSIVINYILDKIDIFLSDRIKAQILNKK